MAKSSSNTSPGTSSDTPDVLLKNGVTVEGEKIELTLSTAITAVGSALPGPATQTLDLGGRVILPGFVDAHVHLDKTLSLGRPELENDSGTLLEAIERWQEVKAGLPKEDYLDRARRAVAMAMRYGTTAMRSHVDIDPSLGLTALEALLEVKEEVRGGLELQLVALGRIGGSPDQNAIMTAAIEAGSDYVGGAPALMDDPAASVRAALDLAERYDKPIDLHIDETDDPTMATLETLADETIARGLQGRVTAGHCVSLGAMEEARAQQIIDKVAAARIDVITLPSVNLVLQGRGDTYKVRRGLTRVKELLAAGVNVAAGSDNVQDPFNPFGNYDLLWIANLAAHAAHLTGSDERRDALRLVSERPAKTLGLDYGLHVGAAANLVVLDTTDPTTALASLPPRYLTLKSGRVTYQHPDAAPSLAQEVL